MKYTHIIWDFNGTLINDVETSIKTINPLLIRRNMKTIDSIMEYHRAFCFPIIQYYVNLGFDFEKESFDVIAIEWMRQYLVHSQNTPLYVGVMEVLNAIKNSGGTQIILSATEKVMLTGQVKDLGIDGYFKDVLGLDNIHANSKVDIAKAWMKREKPPKALMIGDTTHDFDVAKAMGVDCILVANGHQSKADLQNCGGIIVDDIIEILGFVN